MNKQEFLSRLRKGLSGLSQQDIEERVIFYNEIIDDRIEEGIPEEDAVAEIGSVDEITAQITADIPPAKTVEEKAKPKRTIKAWEIVLLVLGAPIWLSLLIAAAAVIFAFCIVLWSLVVSLWAVEVSLIGSFLGCTVAGIATALHGSGAEGAFMLGAGFICAGLSLFLLFGCLGASKGICLLTKNIALGIKNLFFRKENS